jgi:hypothetical protein
MISPTKSEQKQRIRASILTSEVGESRKLSTRQRNWSTLSVLDGFSDAMKRAEFVQIRRHAVLGSRHQIFPLKWSIVFPIESIFPREIPQFHATRFGRAEYQKVNVKNPDVWHRLVADFKTADSGRASRAFEARSKIVTLPHEVDLRQVPAGDFANEKRDDVQLDWILADDLENESRDAPSVSTRAEGAEDDRAGMAIRAALHALDHVGVTHVPRKVVNPSLLISRGILDRLEPFPN